MSETQLTDEKQTPAWQPIGSVERRVLGVLVEKSKTTPDVYPMTINSIRTAGQSEE